LSDEHPSRLEILEFIEGILADSQNNRIGGHIQRCDRCFKIYESLVEAINLLRDGDVIDHIDDDAEAAEDFIRGLVELRDELDCAERDARAADALLLQLAPEPVENWQAVIAQNPHICTSALVRRLVAQAEPEMYRRPERAHTLLGVAESIAYGIQEPESLRARGLVWRQRATALRIQNRYDEALSAAGIATRCFEELRAPDTEFAIGQVHFTMAAIFFEMMRHEPAFSEVARARELLSPYGLSAPLAKVMMLEALLNAERGDVAKALETLRELLPIEEHLGQPFDVGLVRLNLAECNLRLGHLDTATGDAHAAIEIFHALGNVAHETRGEWIVAMIRLARGETEAIERLHEIANIYRELGMLVETGLVKLDITAELLEREEWAGAATLARELVPLFSSAGVTLASVDAIHYLRRAVENHEATAATARYVRSYVAANHPGREFNPPTSKPN